METGDCHRLETGGLVPKGLGGEFCRMETGDWRLEGWSPNPPRDWEVILQNGRIKLEILILDWSVETDVKCEDF